MEKKQKTHKDKNKKLELLKEEIKKCEEKKNGYLEGWKRERADFLNYKKGESERIGELIKYTIEEVVLKILPILDSFDIALEKCQNNKKNNDWIQGFSQIKKQILEFLKSQGVEEIISEGKIFDPNFHEATQEKELENVNSGIVVGEVQKGYLINGKVLRPAKVIVAK